MSQKYNRINDDPVMEVSIEKSHYTCSYIYSCINLINLMDFVLTKAYCTLHQFAQLIKSHRFSDKRI